ncbi:hypothetical protein BCR37DRAFT_390146 [Protomyces lactucae-debilis]|uniref:Uncharacterized protein n=1 Tax=Protomyces lactucae-debilis TaxID=2754530 RepID=A0A1Y2FVL8_PROLT|nr:uncharacterized protein BCR37DRAFT_390146 [Protomyces lactucae-debilis]ORY87607.1 hypothetical protein BCR37DRAFT_390146 [Protomyces lactucae-debilis]
MRITRLLRQAENTAQATSLPPRPPKPESRHIGFYRQFGRPLTRVFLMSSITYYSLHYLYWSLDYDEMSAEKQQQIRSLEAELDAKTRTA